MLTCVCLWQLEKQKGTSPEEMKKNKYYNEEAITFVETVLDVLTLDAAHRYEVSVHFPTPRIIETNT